MTDRFQLKGSYSTSVLSGSPLSGGAQVGAQLDEHLQLGKKAISELSLDGDAPVTVDLCGMAVAHVVILRTNARHVTARVTSADGTTQSIPVNPLAVIISKNVPVTALDLTRAPGVSTTVNVFLGERPA